MGILCEYKEPRVVSEGSKEKPLSGSNSGFRNGLKLMNGPNPTNGGAQLVKLRYNIRTGRT